MSRQQNIKSKYVELKNIYKELKNKKTTEEDETETFYSIKDNFLDKCYHGTNGFQLPFIFQPNSDVEEYAICRVSNKSMQFEQVASQTYSCNLDIVEVW